MSLHRFFGSRFHLPISRRVTVALAALTVTLWVIPNEIAASDVAKVSKLMAECRSGEGKACDELAKLAVKDKSPNVRSAAVAELTDQSLLGRIAVEDKESSVRSAAVAKLTDQSLLSRIAVEDKESSVRSAAVAKLTDQLLLAKIAMASTDDSVGSAAVAELADQATLVNVASNASVLPNIRYAAAGRILDADVLRRIADKENSGVLVRLRMQNIVALRRLLVESDIFKQPVWISLRITDRFRGYCCQEHTNMQGVSVRGETVEISIMAGQKTVVAHGSWTAEFPERFNPDYYKFGKSEDDFFIPTYVDLTDLFVDLRRSAGFSASQANLALARIAVREDRRSNIREDAMSKLTTLRVGHERGEFNTPLHWVADNGDKEVAQLLVASGADLNAKDLDGRTPLHIAASKGHKDVTEMLLADGAEVNAKDREGKTPLHLAAVNGHMDLVELLRQHGGHE